ncbi:MAG: RlmE family RNA methyltransferase [Alphaproteobacteria bacterium]|nr:RlmE family RNA methyltransferase [Alphaproteobacteria bacterium]
MATRDKPDPRLRQNVAAKGRTASSARWLTRQANDPYVDAAKRQGYRSRAAFKLIDMDSKYRLLRVGARVVDLGAAPGGWTQVAVARVGADRGQGKVVAADLLEIAPIPGATILKLDFLADDAVAVVKAALAGPADVVLSDMAPSSTGHREVDHLRILNLVEAALGFACEVLRPGGAFVAKLLQGGGEQALLKEIGRNFATVRRVKPPSSRSESSEFYVVATGFKAAAAP